LSDNEGEVLSADVAEWTTFQSGLTRLRWADAMWVCPVDRLPRSARDGRLTVAATGDR
jgi:hypothetical protein